MMPPFSSSTAPPSSTLSLLSISPFLHSTTATASLSTRALDARRTRPLRKSPYDLSARSQISLGAGQMSSFSGQPLYLSCVFSSASPRRRVPLCPATPSTPTSSPHLLRSQIHASDVSTSPVFLPPPPATLDLDSTHPHPAAICRRPITPVARALRSHSISPSRPLPTSRATFGQSDHLPHLPHLPHRSRLLRSTPLTRELVSGQYITFTIAPSTAVPSPLLSPALNAIGDIACFLDGRLNAMHKAVDRIAARM
ncbi:hypothetical protein MVEN_00318600 [Mycena venus]|uniref:Uncharacterized protein n=1 Tax=Mycena venus TaxID=2733690 RepID=A0A8H6YSR4_9AGAR|nr:hypothetical protein MVEN_00318600 [Mycena venus]